MQDGPRAFPVRTSADHEEQDRKTYTTLSESHPLSESGVRSTQAYPDQDVDVECCSIQGNRERRWRLVLSEVKVLQKH